MKTQSSCTVCTVKDRILSSEKVFFIVLFALCFLPRLATLFNDFYDVDELSAIVQTKQWLAGYIKDIDFTESKLPLYHALFKLSYLISPSHGWVIVHFLTIVIIYCTSLFIYFAGKRISGQKSGMLAAALYGILISSFNRHFMATNGEIIYNLPVMAGAFFFITAVSERTFIGKAVRAFMSIACIVAAMEVKFHGVILAIFIAFILFFYLPYYKGMIKKLIPLYAAAFCAAVGVLFYIHFAKNPKVDSLIFSITGKIFYASTARDSNPLFLIGIYILRQGMLALWHYILWVPGFVLLYRFIRAKGKTPSFEESSYTVLFVMTLLMVFGGGARMYYHYFMAAYPALCIITATSLCNASGAVFDKVRKKLVVLIMIPFTFFFAWNMKDIVIRNIAPSYFYNESNAMFWFRAIFVSSMNDYLLPNKSYVQTVEYIKNHTKKEDILCVWGDGPQLYYFAERLPSFHHMWPRTTIIRMEQNYASGSPDLVKYAESEDRGFINEIEKRKAELFIDTSPKGLHVSVTRFGNFALFPHTVTPLLKKYLNEKYTLEALIDDYRIYRRKK
jgi:hypothetical protein